MRPQELHGEAPQPDDAEDELKATFEMPVGWYGQPVYVAAMAQSYAHEYGLPPRALASVSAEAHRHALTLRVRSGHGR